MIAQAVAVTLQRLADSKGLAMGPRVDENGIDGVDGRMKMAPLAVGACSQFAAVVRSQILAQAITDGRRRCPPRCCNTR